MKTKQPTPRKQIRKVSEKLARQREADGVKMYGRTVVPKKSATPAKARKAITPKKRSTSEFARIYGSKARVAWIKTQPCVGCRNESHDGHHIAGDGIGRKAHHSLIVPTCRLCHRYIHNHGARAFEAMYHVTLAVEAERIAKEWYAIETGTAWHDATANVSVA